MSRSLRAALLAAISACLCLAAARASEPVELYYFVNQKLFKVSAFENGLPKLDQELDKSEAPDPDNLANQSWQIRGALPLTPQYAAPLVDYAVRRRPQPYAQRFEAPLLEVKPRVATALKKIRWKGDKDEGIVVFGWIEGGELRGAFVTRSDAKPSQFSDATIEISESASGGRLFAWLIRDGAPVERAPGDFDALFFGDALEAEDYQRLAKAADSDGATALHFASAAGFAEHIAGLLEARSLLIRKRDEAGDTPLLHAARCGRLAAIRVLLDAGASGADGESFTDSSLYEATVSGHLESLQALAPDKPKAGKEREQYSWALASAINGNQEALARHLIGIDTPIDLAKEARGNSVLKKFVDGFPELALLLMDRHKVPATYSEAGYNFFHAAAPYADNELLDRLLALGVDLAQRSEKGALPMDVAVGLGNVEAICWFIDNGGRGETGEGIVDPVFFAIQEGQPESVRCLIDYGFDVNREVVAGVTPLMFAVYQGELEIARAITGAGGAWELDSLRMDRVVSKILEKDAADLLASVLDQGWPRDRRLMGDFGLQEIAEFFGATASLDELARRSWPREGLPLRAPSELDQAPRLLKALEVEYPHELQEQFGEREVTVAIALGSVGAAAAIRIEGDLEPELAKVVERAVEKLQFEPALLGGEAVPVRLKFKIPLAVDMSTENVFDLADVDTRPGMRAMVPPQYPYELQEQKISGRVVVEFVLDADGVPQQLRAVSFTHEAFAARAIECVAKSQWTPARKNGKPVACRVRLPVEFKP